jgi:hypothetical protein
MLGRAVDDQGRLKAAADQEAGGLPKNLAEVVLFDALNSEGFAGGQREQVQRWVIAQIRNDLRELAKPTTDHDEYLKNRMVRFRGYFSEGSAYATRYKHLKDNIAAALKTEIAKAEAGQRAARGRPSVPGWKLTPDQKQALTDNYVNSIQGVATSHEKIMGQGKVRESLSALPVQQLRARDQQPPAPVTMPRQAVVVQRDPPPVDPDLAQWTADWNDPQFAGARRYFDETSRPSGAPETRYKVLCPLYKAHGVPRPLPYIKDSINPSTTFFGQTTPAHTGMQAMLAAAEKTLRDLKDDKGNPRYTSTPLRQRRGPSPSAPPARTSGATTRTGGPSTSIRTPTRTWTTRSTGRSSTR